MADPLKNCTLDKISLLDLRCTSPSPPQPPLHSPLPLIRFLSALGEGVIDEVTDLVGVSELVVVPADELDEPGTELDARVGVEDGGLGGSHEILADDHVLGVGEDSLHGGLGCLRARSG